MAWRQMIGDTLTKSQRDVLSETAEKFFGQMTFLIGDDAFAFLLCQFLEHLPKDKRVDAIGAIAREAAFFDPEAKGKIKTAIDAG
jgi:hypothetical protein